MTSPTLRDARNQRWGMDQPPLETADEAAAYIRDLGFMFLFADTGGSYPALREAVRDDDSPQLPAGWGEDFERMWTWKDELPTEGRAWVGRFLANRQSLLSPELLGLLRDDEEEAQILSTLSPAARRMFEFIDVAGPMSMRLVRQELGINSRTSQQALAELGQRLLVTNYGTQADGPGWPSCVVELTSRAFPDGDDRPVRSRQCEAGLFFLRTMISADARQLARAFRWPRPVADAVLSDLVEQGRIVAGDGRAYQIV